MVRGVEGSLKSENDQLCLFSEGTFWFCWTEKQKADKVNLIFKHSNFKQRH